MNNAVGDILAGCFLLFFDNWTQIISVKASRKNNRSIDEPVSEPVVLGPRKGTVDGLDVNIGIIRSQLPTPNLKVHIFHTNGPKKTQVMYAYVKDTVKEEVLIEFKNRISKIDKEVILDPSYIEGLIEDSSYSIFPQHRYTERSDVAVSALLEGKIIVMVDGSGMILICPGLFIEAFQSVEDYYRRTIFASLVRILRLLAFIIAIFLPSTYIALSTFHPELIPTVLLLAITKAREGIPFPSVVEIFIMEFFFELLREAGIRLPRPAGSAVSIVGALIIGEAAIEAGISSPVVVVIVALTGISSFIFHYHTATGIRVLRFLFMILAAVLGGFGIMIGFFLLLFHLVNLRSLGVPYLWPLAPFHSTRIRDVFIRVPLKKLLRKTHSVHEGDEE